MMSAVWLVFRREWQISFRRWSDLLSPLVFFTVTAALFPLAVSPLPNLLKQIGPGVLWVTALLAMLISMQRLFREDFEDGSLEQLALSPQPLPLLMLGKVLAFWVQTAVPLILLAPVVGVAYQLPTAASQVLILSLLLGTPALCMLGSVAAALTVGLRQGAGLLAILLLPLCIPVLIFGARAVDLAAGGFEVQGPLMLIAAISVLTVTLAPFATAAAVRVSLD